MSNQKLPPAEVAPKPFVKWAGGKRALVSEILKRVPNFPGTYIEPFLGGGSVALSMPPEVSKRLSDSNSELINAYLAVRDDPEKLILELQKHKNTKSHFLKVRAWDRELEFKDMAEIKRAARFIYLNKTCFNGLYRVNKAGYFNVPYGDQKNADFVSEKNIRVVSNFLDKKHTEIICESYSTAIMKAGEGDFVYVDPPYDPINKTSSFVNYQATGFSNEDQENLRNLLMDAHSRGATILASNNDTALIRNLYSKKAGWRIEKVNVPRLIGATSSSRKKIGELLMMLEH